MKSMTSPRPLSRGLAAALAGLTLAGTTPSAWGANHREAPITALDHKADITDIYAFVSYTASQQPNTTPSRVTLILDVDPLLEPGNGPTYFPFDPEILYAIRIDNDRDAREDVTFEVRFKTEIRAPGLLKGLWQSYAGVGSAGATAPTNSPPPVSTGTLVIPPQITALDGPGSLGLVLRQSYEITMVHGRPPAETRTELVKSGGGSLFVVPSDAGPRTMNYPALFNQGIYSVGGGGCNGIKAFAGTVDDPFWIDLGGAFDTLNTSINPPILSAAQDAAQANIASDFVSGYNVNAIAIEVPITCLTSTGRVEPATSANAVIGTWGTTSRPRIKVYPSRPGFPSTLSANVVQIQRMGNALINELLIGTGDKDKFSMERPKNDAQFANYLLDPLLPRVINAAFAGAVPIPAPPRLDLAPLVFYAPPICPACTSPALQGPIADLLRLNTGVPATPLNASLYSRLGLIGGDPAGYPNGRRLQDDVTDISLRVVTGVLNPSFNVFPNNKLGDGVNVNDSPYRTQFPYLADAWGGRDRRHIDPGEPGCTGGAGGPCAP